MTFCELKSGHLWSESRVLQPGEIVVGRVNGRAVSVEVVDDETIDLDGMVKQGSEGALIFDKPGFFSQERMLVYLDAYKSIRMSSVSHDSGAFQDALISLRRLGQEQVGLRKPGQRSIGEWVSAVISLGWTEYFTS